MNMRPSPQKNQRISFLIKRPILNVIIIVRMIMEVDDEAINKESTFTSTSSSTRLTTIKKLKGIDTQVLN